MRLVFLFLLLFHVSDANIVKLEDNVTLSSGNTYLWSGGRYRGIVTIRSDDPLTLVVPCSEELVPNFIFTCDNYCTLKNTFIMSPKK